MPDTFFSRFTHSIVSAVVGVAHLSESPRTVMLAHEFVLRTVGAMQIHYRIALQSICAVCACYVWCIRGKSFNSLSSIERLRLLENWCANGIPGVAQCARFFLTISVLAVYDSDSALVKLGVDVAQLRAVERYYSGIQTR